MCGFVWKLVRPFHVAPPLSLRARSAYDPAALFEEIVVFFGGVCKAFLHALVFPLHFSPEHLTGGVWRGEN